DPVGGEIFYRARYITQYPVQELRRKVGFVFQTPVMFPGTVRDNLHVALALSGEPGQDADKRIAEALELAELEPALCDRAGDRLSEARRTSDRTIVLERGRIVASGSTTDVFGSTTKPRMRAFLDSEK